MRTADQPLRRPLLVIAAAWLGGTWLALAHGSTPWLLPAAWSAWSAAAILLLLVRGAALRRAGHAALVAAIAGTAWVAGSLHPDTSRGLAWLPGDSAQRTASVVGVVAGDPEKEPVGKARAVWQFPLSISQSGPAGARLRPDAGRIQVSWYGLAWTNCFPAYGEEWLLRGEWNARRAGGVLATDARNSRCLSAGHGSEWVMRCYALRRRAAATLALGLEDFPETVGILQALVLGYQSRISSEAHDFFTRTGTLHIFAISGSHVAILAGLVAGVLGFLRISRVYWALFIAPILVAYTVAAGAPASAVRACVMGVLFFLAPLVGRRPDALSTLAASAVIVTAWSPPQLLDVGFVLSFVVVLGLIVLYPLFLRPLQRLWQPDAFQPDPEKRLRGWRAAAQYAGSLLALSCAAWVASTPLTAFYFEQVTPVSLASNLLVIPMAFLVMLGGCLSLVLGPCAAWLADVFNHANLLLADVMVKAMRHLSDLPLACIEVRRPSPQVVWLFYALLGVGAAVLGRWQTRGAAPDREAAE